MKLKTPTFFRLAPIAAAGLTLVLQGCGGGSGSGSDNAVSAVSAESAGKVVEVADADAGRMLALAYQPSVLLGARTVSSGLDSNPAGLAEAFRYVAARSGSADSLHLYLDAGSTANRIVVGVYADGGSGPGVLLGSANLDAPVSGQWNAAKLPALQLNAGATYWVALLAPVGHGVVKFRDAAQGTQPSIGSSDRGLGALPATWSSGERWRNSPASLYITARQEAPAPSPSPAPPPGSSALLVGSASVHPSVDTNPAGVAEAFSYAALASGTVNALQFYVDTASTAPRVVAGIYADADGRPGALLARGALDNPVKGQWNGVNLPAFAVASGRKYWIALLAPTGTLAFRDLATGGGANVTSSQANLGDLPAAWSTGQTYGNSPASAYLSGVVAEPAPSPAPSPAPAPAPSPAPSPAPAPAPSPAPSPAPAPSPSSLAVKVSGNKLVNAAGAPLRLRGVNASGAEFVCAQGFSNDAFGGQPFSALATYRAMASWKINVVRIPLNEYCWLNFGGSVKGADYQAQIKQAVDLAHQAGLYVILDLHWNAPKSSATQSPIPALSQQPAPDADYSVTFWRQVASAYKSYPAVIFDLYNEPFSYWGTNADPWAGWLNGDTQTQYMTGDGNQYTISMNWKTAGMQQLVDAVRSTGATNPIIVNGMDWSNDIRGWLSHAPTDPLNQLIVGAHIYPNQPGSNAAYWEQHYPPLAARYPVLIGETGDSVASATFLPTFLPYAESHGWHYVAWTWNVWGHPDNVLITDWNGTPNLGEGKVFRDFLLSH